MVVKVIEIGKDDAHYFTRDRKVGYIGELKMDNECRTDNNWRAASIGRYDFYQVKFEQVNQK